MNENNIKKCRDWVDRFKDTQAVSERSNISLMLVGYLDAVLDSYEETAESVEEEPEEAPTQEPVSDGRRRKTCSYCGEPGHMPKTCRKKRLEERLPEPELGPEPTKKDPEDDGDADEPLKTEESDEDAVDPLTEDEFEYVKNGQREGSSSGDIASEIGVPIAEVNAAWVSKDYEDYIENR